MAIFSCVLSTAIKERFTNKWEGWQWAPPYQLRPELYMEAFEQEELELAPLKPRMYKRFMDGIINMASWIRKIDRFRDTSTIVLHQNIKFTGESEVNGTLLFLDILLIRNTNRTPGHTVYRKAMHAN